MPVVLAPMAGGAGTPELAAAVSGAGGLGFLAAGYLTAEGLREQVRRLRGLTDQPFGVNVFVPGPGAVDGAAVARYWERLDVEARRYGVALGDALGDDDDWAAKLELLRQERVALVSFTFGCPPAPVIAGLRAVGSEVAVTVTSAAEAAEAAGRGADALVVQGPEAGAHRGTFDNELRHDDPGLLALLRRVRAAVELPLVATGGLSCGRDVAAVLVAGAVAAQLGTLFLACPESGAHPVHKAALTDPTFERTAVTRAFSGRPARGLVNRFMREHGDEAPAAYPHVHHVTKGLRRASAQAGDPHAMSLWAGQGHAFASGAPAAEVVRALDAQAREALAEAAARWAPAR